MHGDTDDSELALSGYLLIRHDRNCHGGGVLIFVCSCMHVDVLFRVPDT